MDPSKNIALDLKKYTFGARHDSVTATCMWCEIYPWTEKSYSGMIWKRLKIGRWSNIESDDLFR